MSVKHCVYSGGMIDHVRRSVRHICCIYTEMAQEYTVVCPLCPCRIHCALYGAVQILSVCSFFKTVNDIAVFIFESVRGAFCYGFWCSCADKCDLATCCLDDLIGFKHKSACSQVCKVAGNVGELRFSHQTEELIHTVVKLMVSRSHHIVIKGVHYVHDGFAL